MCWTAALGRGDCLVSAGNPGGGGDEAGPGSARARTKGPCKDDCPLLG